MWSAHQVTNFNRPVKSRGTETEKGIAKPREKTRTPSPQLDPSGIGPNHSLAYRDNPVYHTSRKHVVIVTD